MTTKTADHLVVGDIYTRQDLRERFHIRAASLNNGIFRPAGHNSVWLFVTEHKTADRTQYTDLLDGDVLNMDGQLKGRTDRLIIDHRENALDLLLFYRRHRDEYPGYGFRYEGAFEYVSHSGEYPAHFRLRRKPPVQRS